MIKDFKLKGTSTGRYYQQMSKTLYVATPKNSDGSINTIKVKQIIDNAQGMHIEFVDYVWNPLNEKFDPKLGVPKRKK